MHIKREFKIFRQKFNTPLRTAHGLWDVRETILLKETYDGRSFSFGEVAPTPGFNAFTLKDALKETEIWLLEGDNELYKWINPAITSLKSSIWKNCASKVKKVVPASLYFNSGKIPKYCGVIKKKIGLKCPKEEIPEVLSWIKNLPTSMRVRLDPNQSFDLEKLQVWLDALEDHERVEFIEQPVPGIPCDEILNIISMSSVPIALDEAIVSHGGLRTVKKLGWDGYFVVKPTLLDDWSETISFIKDYPDKCIVSTVFESPIGYEAVIRTCLHSNLVPGVDRRVYQGCSTEFKLHHKPVLSIPSVKNDLLNKLWNNL